MDKSTPIERYKTIIELAPDVVYTLSTKGVITSLSPSFEQITGWKRSDWIGKKFKDIVHPDDLPQALKIFGESMDGATHKFYELRILAKDGRYLDFEFSGTPDVVDNKVIGKIGFARDVTAHKEHERLYVNHSKLGYHYTDIVRSSDVAIISRDLSGCIETWNTAAEKLFGFKASEIIGKNFSIIVPLDQRKEFLKMTSRTKKGEIIEGYETTRLTKSGKLIPIIANVSPIRDAKGKIIGISAFDRDNTDTLRQKKHEVYLS